MLDERSGGLFIFANLSFLLAFFCVTVVVVNNGDAATTPAHVARPVGGDSEGRIGGREGDGQDGVFTVGGGGTSVVFTEEIPDHDVLEKRGPAQVTLNCDLSKFEGRVLVVEGSLKLAKGAKLPSDIEGLTIADGASFDLGAHSITVHDLSRRELVEISGAPTQRPRLVLPEDESEIFVAVATGRVSVFAGAVEGSGKLSKRGKGTLDARAVSFAASVGVYVRDGDVVVSGTTFDGGHVFITKVENRAHGKTEYGTLVLHRDRPDGLPDTEDKGVQIKAFFDGGGTLAKDGSGTVIVSTPHPRFHGVVHVKRGKFVLDGSDIFPLVRALRVDSGAVFDLKGNNFKVGELSGGGEVVLDNGTLTFNIERSNADNADDAPDSTFDGSVTGVGEVVKDKPGWLVFSGTNTYKGSTRILKGKLSGRVSSFGTSPNLVVASDATLEFTETGQSERATFSGVIDGPGEVRLSGPVTWAPDTSSGHSGKVVVSGLDVILESINVDLEVQVDKLVTITGGHLAGESLSGSLSGMGTVVIDAGQGEEFKFSGDGSGFGGHLRVVSGTFGLRNNGREEEASVFFGASVHVARGAVLGGNARIKNRVTLDDGAKLAPDVGGTMYVDELNFADGAVCEVKFTDAADDASISARVVKSYGGLHIGHKAVLKLNGIGWKRTRSAHTQIDVKDIVVIEAEEAIEGRFGYIASELIGYAPAVMYEDNRVIVHLYRRHDRFGKFAETENQKELGEMFDSYRGSARSYNALLAVPVEELSSAFDKLSGEIHASAVGVLERRVGSINSALSWRTYQMTMRSGDYPKSARDVSLFKTFNRPSIWSVVVTSIGETSGGVKGSADLDVGSIAVVNGVDFDISGKGRMGAVAAYVRDKYGIAEGRDSTGVSVSYHLGLYGSAGANLVDLNYGLFVSSYGIQVLRKVKVGNLSEILLSNYGAASTAGFVEVLYGGFNSWFGIALKPFCQIAGFTAYRSSFKEEGGVFALSGQYDSFGSVTAVIGVSGTLDLFGDLDFASVRYRLAWQNRLGSDLRPTAKLSFADIPSDDHYVTGIGLDDGALVLRLGAQISPVSGVESSINYRAIISENSYNSGLVIDGGINF